MERNVKGLWRATPDEMKAIKAAIRNVVSVMPLAMRTSDRVPDDYPMLNGFIIQAEAAVGRAFLRDQIDRAEVDLANAKIALVNHEASA